MKPSRREQKLAQRLASIFGTADKLSEISLPTSPAPPTDPAINPAINPAIVSESTPELALEVTIEQPQIIPIDFAQPQSQIENQKSQIPRMAFGRPRLK